MGVCMPTLVSESKTIHRENGYLTAFGEDEEIIRSTQVPGCHLRREWLNPDKLPEVASCLEMTKQ